MIEDRWQLDAISDLRRVASDMRPPGLALEETLHPFVAFVILPLFAFFNAGVAVSGNVLDALRHPVGLGVVLGLVLGKQVGVTVFTWLAVTLARAERPEGVSWSQIYGGACLAGIGFTMSMFVDQLAFSDPANVDRAKIGILIASVVAAGMGRRGARPAAAPSEDPANRHGPAEVVRPSRDARPTSAARTARSPSGQASGPRRPPRSGLGPVSHPTPARRTR